MAVVVVTGAVLVGWKWHPAPGGFAVVELFTSEGCSSCPSAEALMARTQQEDKDLPVYCLAFHVDYWDRQGWKDVFSDKSYTDRQQQYARWLRLNEIYTPQAVVNGTSEFVGSNAVSLKRAIRSGLQQDEGMTLALSELRLHAGRLDWQYKLDGLASGGGGHVQLVFAIVEKNAVTSVKGGENNGRTLSEAQVVRQFRMQPVDMNGPGSGHLDWPEGLAPSDAEIIAWLQDWSTGKILTASRATIPKWFHL